VVPFATGAPYSFAGRSTAWDLKPILGFACSLILLRGFVRIRLSWAIVGACLLGGTVLSSLVDAWGVVPATSLALTIVLVLRVAIWRRRPGLSGGGS